MTRDDFFRDVLLHRTAVAELGVFLGEFSDTIMRLARPCWLTLVDTWDAQVFASGDANGDNIITVSGFPAVYQRLKDRYAGEPTVNVVRMNSLAFLGVTTLRYDCIYIDTTHEYDQTRAELEAAIPRIVPGGWLAGHDLNEPGVSRAVGEMIARCSFRQTIVTSERCPSYFLQLWGD